MNFFAMKWIDIENSNLPKLIKFSKLCGQNIKKKQKPKPTAKIERVGVPTSYIHNTYPNQ